MASITQCTQDCRLDQPLEHVDVVQQHGIAYCLFCGARWVGDDDERLHGMMRVVDWCYGQTGGVRIDCTCGSYAVVPQQYSPASQEYLICQAVKKHFDDVATLGKCEECGCDELHACDPPCAWDPTYLRDNRFVCTRCAATTTRHGEQV